jgi:hypothetical protein
VRYFGESVIRTAAGLAIAGAAVGLMACKSEVVEEAPPQESQQGSVFTEEQAQAAAEAMLLTLEDLPEGWKQLPVDEDDDDDPPLPELTGDCAGLLDEDSVEKGRMAEAESREFASPDEEMELQFSAEVFADEAAAVQSFVDMRLLVGDCRGQFEAAFLEALKAELQSRQPEGEPPLDLEVTRFELSELQFGGFGDESGAMRLSNFFLVEGSEFATYIDLVGVRVGNVVGGFSLQTNLVPPDAAAAEGFAAQVEERAREAAVSLGGGGPAAGARVGFTRGEALAAAEGATLTREDLPGEWTIVEHDREFVDSLMDALSGGDLPELPAECQLFLDIHLSRTDRGVAEVWSDGFIGREIGTVDSSVAVFESEDEAGRAVEKLRLLVEACPEPIKEFWTRLSEVSQGGPVTVTKYEFGELSLASSGDESFALRMAIVAEGPDEDDVTKDIAVLRAGNVVGLLHYTSSWGDPEPDRELEEQLLEIMEQRAIHAAASLN